MVDIAEDPAAGQPAPTGQPPALEPEAADQRAAPEAEEADAGAAEAAGPPEGACGEEGAQTGAGAADESGNGSAAAPSQQEEEQNSAAAGDAPVAEAEGLAGETAALHLAESEGAAASAVSEPEEAAGIAVDQAATCGEQEAGQSLTEGGAEVAAEDEGKEGEEEQQQEEQQQEEQAPSPAPAAVSSHLSRSTRSTRSTKAKLTFTGPPKCLERRPRTAMRSNFSHSQQRVRQILRDNESLVRRLGDIAYQQPEHERFQQKHDRFMANVAATAAARRRVEAHRIMQQNLRIYQRLQEVKPSRDVARACHDKDFAKHEKMLAALAALRRKNGGSGGWVK